MIRPGELNERTVLAAMADLEPDATPADDAPALSSIHTLPEGTQLLDYEIVGLIGEGGFGIVYLAYDRSLERHVAIKEYLPAVMASRAKTSQSVVVKSQRHADNFRVGLRSFVNEARLLARFDHPSLVKVLRFWEGNGTAYMVMPYYEGPTLAHALQTLGRVPDEQELRAWLRPLLHALSAMHAVSCFHRDIAPDNILLTQKGPLLLDFGAARRVISNMAQAPTVVIKPGFAPIEQYGEAPSMKQGPWTDLYALAGVVYAAITGHPPMASVERLMDDRMKPLSELAAGRYSPTFLTAIDEALALRPHDRPQSAAAFWERLNGGSAEGGAAASGSVPTRAPLPLEPDVPEMVAMPEPAPELTPEAAPELDLGSVPAPAAAFVGPITQPVGEPAAPAVPSVAETPAFAAAAEAEAEAEAEAAAVPGPEVAERSVEILDRPTDIPRTVSLVITAPVLQDVAPPPMRDATASVAAPRRSRTPVYALLALVCTIGLATMVLRPASEGASVPLPVEEMRPVMPVKTAASASVAAVVPAKAKAAPALPQPPAAVATTSPAAPLPAAPAKATASEAAPRAAVAAASPAASPLPAQKAVPAPAAPKSAPTATLPPPPAKAKVAEPTPRPVPAGAGTATATVKPAPATASPPARQALAPTPRQAARSAAAEAPARSEAVAIVAVPVRSADTRRRCSEIVQRASIEPLKPGEAAFLKRECQP